MSRISQAFRSFFALLFSGKLPDDIAKAHGFSRAPARAPAPVVQVTAADGALQILGILQRDARLIDFMMEDIAGYSDDQVGAAVRNLHDQCRESLARYLKLVPLIDGVEGTFTKIEGGAAKAVDPARIKLLGNVPADGRAPGGLLRHKGWRAEKVELPRTSPNQSSILAPAEIEIE